MKFLKVLCFLIIVLGFSCGCKKEDATSENSGKISFTFQSKYTVNTVITTIFEGWVNPSKEDSFEGSKNFYSAFRTKDLSFKKELKPGPYTVMSYYGDFGKLFVEKVEVSAGSTKNVDFNFDESVKINLGKINPFYNTKSDYFVLNFSIPIQEPQYFGVKSHLYLNGKEIFITQESGYNLGYKIVDFLEGKNEIEAQIIYKDGSKDSKKISFYAFDKNTINDVWSLSKEDYLKKEEFNSYIFSSQEDVFFNNKKSYKCTIINGLYGQYNFTYKNNILQKITVNHGDINREPLLSFENVKSVIDSHFGESQKMNYNEYIYKLDGFKLSLQNNSGIINTIITKE